MNKLLYIELKLMSKFNLSGGIDNNINIIIINFIKNSSM